MFTGKYIMDSTLYVYEKISQKEALVRLIDLTTLKKTLTYRFLLEDSAFKLRNCHSHLLTSSKIISCADDVENGLLQLVEIDLAQRTLRTVVS